MSHMSHRIIFINQSINQSINQLKKFV